MSQTVVFKWDKLSKDGRESLEDGRRRQESTITGSVCVKC